MCESNNEGKFMDSVKIEVRLQHENPVDIITMANSLIALNNMAVEHIGKECGAKETKLMVTAEEHSVVGGLGSAISEYLSEEYPTKIKKVGIYDRFGQSGEGAELLEKYELTAKKIIEVVKGSL